VSPKAIYTIDEFERVRRFNYSVTAGQFEDDQTILTLDSEIGSGYATGDYSIFAAGNRYQITDCAGMIAKVNGRVSELKSGDNVELHVRLQKPAIDIEKCIGCGICEHECPVSGKRGVRVSSEGESRDESSRLLLSPTGGAQGKQRRYRGGRG
jgi:NAD-dependent dihydropyrimidine dehydrogenase PreA subunit